MSDEPLPTYQEAEALRRSGKYGEACAQFEQIWQQNPSSFVGWRHAFCLRKMGRLAEAQRIAESALARYPEDKYTKAEMGWVLYERELKPAKSDNDLARACSVADRILSLAPDTIIKGKVALAVMKVAKSRKNWRVLLQWAERLTPADLSKEPMIFEGKRGMSDLETWYVGKARALLELGRYEEARQCAQAGLTEIPDEVFLRRTSALALAYSGDLRAGIAEMRVLLRHRRAGWYMKADLAKLMGDAGDFEEAYGLMCEAVSSAGQSEEYMLEYLVSLAEIARNIGNLDAAAAHVAWAKEIRVRNGWRVPPELVEVEMNVVKALKATGKTWPALPNEGQKLQALCRRHWREAMNRGLVFYRGTVKPYPKERPFTYIQRDDIGDDVYVVVRDLPRSCREPGSRVEFALTKSYDKKKERESVQACNVRCIDG